MPASPLVTSKILGATLLQTPGGVNPEFISKESIGAGIFFEEPASPFMESVELEHLLRELYILVEAAHPCTLLSSCNTDSRGESEARSRSEEIWPWAHL